MKKLPKEIQFLLDKIYDEDIEIVDPKRKLLRGNLYLYGYDPKHKDTLEVYDVLPLGILLDISSKYVWMINVHYIPYLKRIQFVRLIMEKLAGGSRLKYKDIKKAWNKAEIPHAYARLAFRQYIIKRIQTKMRMFDEDNYKAVVQNVLPEFKKQNMDTVYRNIEKKMKAQRKALKG